MRAEVGLCPSLFSQSRNEVQFFALQCVTSNKRVDLGFSLLFVCFFFCFACSQCSHLQHGIKILGHGAAGSVLTARQREARSVCGPSPGSQAGRSTPIAPSCTRSQKPPPSEASAELNLAAFIQLPEPSVFTLGGCPISRRAEIARGELFCWLSAWEPPRRKA